MEIEEDGVEGLCGEEVECSGAFVDLQAVVNSSDLLEVGFDQIAGQRVVIDNEALHGAPELRPLG